MGLGSDMVAASNGTTKSPSVMLATSNCSSAAVPPSAADQAAALGEQ
jgi:hypothetical protein